jgi:hypothetical protein
MLGGMGGTTATLQRLQELVEGNRQGAKAAASGVEYSVSLLASLRSSPQRSSP